MTVGAANEELRLGRYVLKRPLGAGGNGQVFLAWQKNASGEPLVCVVKFPLQRYATDEEGRERFMHEARLAMRLGTHPNIVQVIDVGRHREMPFIVMEYVDGTDLHQLLKRRRRRKMPLSLASVYNILASAAAGLHHAHIGATVAREPIRVVHRDVKPGNILITRDGVTKLGDFGIGTTMDEGTEGEFMRGTYRYMSPEHISRDVRPEMDIYALGVVAWEMVENRQYRQGFQGTQHFTAIMDGDVPPMENPDTPKPLVSLIEACLEPNPRQRPKARELLHALQKCPGYTRDPTDLQAVVESVIGPHRSSGQTQHEFKVTPELAATFAALEVAQVPAAPERDDDPEEAEEAELAPGRPAAPTVVPPPSDRPAPVAGSVGAQAASISEQVTAQKEPAPQPGGHAIDEPPPVRWKAAENDAPLPSPPPADRESEPTANASEQVSPDGGAPQLEAAAEPAPPVVRGATSPAVPVFDPPSSPPSNPDEDAPQVFHRRVRSPVEPTPTVPFGDGAQRQDVPDPTLPLDEFAPIATRTGTAIMPAPWAEALPDPRDDPESDEDAPVVNLSGRTEPAPTASPSQTPGSIAHQPGDTMPSGPHAAPRPSRWPLTPWQSVLSGLLLTAAGALGTFYFLTTCAPQTRPAATAPTDNVKPSPAHRSSNAMVYDRRDDADRPPRTNADAEDLAREQKVDAPPEAVPTAEPAASAEPPVTPSASEDEPISEPQEASPPNPTAPPRSSRREPTQPRGTASIRLVLFLLPEAVVKIGHRKVVVRSGTDLQVPAGRQRIRWRSPDEHTWHDAGRRRFVAGQRYMVRVRASGTADVVKLGARHGGAK